MSITALVPHISCVCTPDSFSEALGQGYKELYILSGKGIIKHHQLRGEDRFVRIKVDSIPGYKEVDIQENIKFLPAGKVPYVLYEQILGFFLKVMKVKTAELEAMIHVLYNKERGYHLGVPPQTISKASVSYDWSYIPNGTSVIVDIHSHNTMGAFFSGTDNSDDRNNVSYSGVFGKLKDETPMTVWRFNYFDKKIQMTASDIFEMPADKEVDIPKEWLDNVKTPTYSTTARSYDHLKKWQYQAGKKSTKREEEETLQSEFFGHEYEGYDSLYGSYNAQVPDHPPGATWRFDPKTGTRKIEESSLSTVTENPFSDAEVEEAVQTHLGKYQDLPGIDDDVPCEKYEIIALAHGPDVADAWWGIDQDMAMLNGKDDLATELIVDMFNMVSSEGQGKLFKELYNQLPRKEQDKISTNGL